jgi:membrane-associated phospholipid phosphatase
MYHAADFIARHAVLVLAVTVAIALVLSGLLWHVVTKLGPRSWLLILELWDRARRTVFAERLRRAPVLGRLLVRTLTVARYLGVIAVLGFAFAVGATVLFFELADEIRIGESLAAFDIALSDALRKHLSRDILQAFSLITHLGDVKILTVISALVFGVLFALRKRLLAAAWLIATASGGLLNWILKAIFERSRPVHDHGPTSATGWSFPSGHASGSMLVYGLLTYLIVRHVPAKWHIPVALAGVALVIFVGSSRVILQVHYLSDVLAGYASAGAWVAIWIGALEAVRWREARANTQ